MCVCVEGIYRVRKKRVYATIFMMCTEKETKLNLFGFVLCIIKLETTDVH